MENNGDILVDGHACKNQREEYERADDREEAPCEPGSESAMHVHILSRFSSLELLLRAIQLHL